VIDAALWKARFSDWLEVRYRSQDTRHNYLASLGRFLEFLNALGLTSWAEVTRDVLEEYRAHVFGLRHPRTGNFLKVGTHVARLMTVKVFFRFLVRDGHLLANPALQLELPRHKKPLPVVLTESEVLKLLETPDTQELTGIRDRAILELLYGTGLRNGEMCSLELDLLDLATHQVRLQRGKGDKGRVLPLGQEAQVWLELYLESVRPFWLRNPAVQAVFLDRWGSGPITRTTVSMLVSQLGKKAGLGKAVTPHSLRHSCATHMLRRGADLRHLQQLLGHEQLSSTEHYTKVEVSDLRRVLSRCHPRESFKKP
jgi:integrase/recombinase XerD